MSFTKAPTFMVREMEKVLAKDSRERESLWLEAMSLWGENTADRHLAEYDLNVEDEGV